MNWTAVITVATGLIMLSNCGCSEQPRQRALPLPSSVHADLSGNTDVKDSFDTGFAKGSKVYPILTVEPNPDRVYPILRVVHQPER